MIKKEHNIQVQMFRVKGDIAPFIEVAFMDKYAQEHTGLLLLDSGSTTNILSCEMSSCIGERWKLEDESATISSIAPEDINADIVKLSFALGGRLFHETFSLSTKPLPIKIMDKTVLGLVGVGFMQKYSLVIDYGDFTLHTSQVNHSNLSISDCDFFFPMEIGLKHYSLPVISVKQKGKDHVTLIDTGSTSNMIAEQTLIDSEFECQRLDGNDVMIGITGEVNVKKAIVRFIMLSLQGDDICKLTRYEHFMLLPCNVYSVKEGEDNQLPPIELLLGSSFMANEGWVLDFGAKIIYKKKI